MGHARVTGTIRDASTGLPLAGAEVCAAAEVGSAAGPLSTARAGDSGAFALDVAWEGEGEADVHLEARGVAHGAAGWTGRVAPGGAVVADLTLGPGFTLALDLVDPEGGSIEGAVVTVVENNTVANACGWPLARRWLPPAAREPRSDAAGHVEIPGLGELAFGWRYFVSVCHPERAEGMLDRPEHLRREAGVARARLVLVEGHAVEGVLHGGRPAEGTIVADLLDPLVPGCHHVTRSAAVDAAGRFRVTGLHAGEHTFHASAPGAASVARKVRVPLEAPLEIELPVSRQARGTLLGEDGAPVVGAEATAEWRGGYQRTTTDAQGIFSFDGLPVGERVEIAARRVAPRWGEALGFALLEPGGEDVDLRFDARARVTWRGRLHDDRTGTPVEGAVRALAVPRGTGIRFVELDIVGDGRFVLRLPPGDYALAFEAMDAVETTSAGEIREASVVEARDDVRVDVVAAFQVPVRVVDAATFAPLAGAAVTGYPEEIWGRLYLGNAGADGIFTIDPAMEVPVRVVAEAEGYARSAPIRVDLRRGMDPIVVALVRA